MEETPNDRPTSNNHIAKRSSKKMTITLTVLLIIAVFAAGVLAFLFVNSSSDLNRTLDELDSSEKQIEKLESQQAKNERESQNSATEVPAESANYFKIPEWNVKFALPEGLTAGEITYVIDGDTARFMTSKVAALGQACAVEDGMIATLVRAADDSLGDGIYARQDGVRAGNYYYFYTSPQSVCSDNNTDLQISQLGLMKEMLAKPIVL